MKLIMTVDLNIFNLEEKQSDHYKQPFEVSMVQELSNVQFLEDQME